MSASLPPPYLWQYDLSKDNKAPTTAASAKSSEWTNFSSSIAMLLESALMTAAPTVSIPDFQNPGSPADAKVCVVHFQRQMGFHLTTGQEFRVRRVTTVGDPSSDTSAVACTPTVTPAPSPSSSSPVRMRCVPEYATLDPNSKNFTVMLEFKAASSSEMCASDVLLLLDNSYSMKAVIDHPHPSAVVAIEGVPTPLPLLKRTCTYLIDQLSDKSRLGMMSFCEKTRKMMDDFTEVKTAAEKEKAKSSIHVLKTEGGTDINKALCEGLDFLREQSSSSSKRMPVCLILTDGRPFDGEKRPDVIIKNVLDRLTIKPKVKEASVMEPFLAPLTSRMIPVVKPPSSIVLHTLGFTSDADTKLLSDIATAAKGTYTFIRDESVMASTLGALWAGIQATVIRSMDIDILCSDGIILDSIEGDGAHRRAASPTSRVSRIELPDMQAEEKKHVLLHFSVTPTQPSSASPVSSPSFRSLCNIRPRVRHGSSDQWTTLPVETIRIPIAFTPSAPAPAPTSSTLPLPSSEVLHQRVRLLACNCIRQATALAEKKQYAEAATHLDQSILQIESILSRYKDLLTPYRDALDTMVQQVRDAREWVQDKNMFASQHGTLLDALQILEKERGVDIGGVGIIEPGTPPPLPPGRSAVVRKTAIVARLYTTAARAEGEIRASRIVDEAGAGVGVGVGVVKKANPAATPAAMAAAKAALDEKMDHLIRTQKVYRVDDLEDIRPLAMDEFSGGQSTAFRAKLKPNGVPIFVKQPKSSDMSSYDMKQHLWELCILGQLRPFHESHIIGCVDGFFRGVDHKMGTMLEEAPFGSLTDYYSKMAPKWSYAQQIAVLTYIAKGIDVLHQQTKPPIVHRDLKPDNLLVFSPTMTQTSKSPQQSPVRVKLADFGMARHVNYDNHQLKSNDADAALSESLNNGGSIQTVHPGAGTVRYMSPEQMRSDTTISFPCDIYAFGGIMYFVYTQGKDPWYQQRSSHQIIQKVQAKHIPAWPTKDDKDDIPPKAFHDLMIHCYAPDPSKRPTIRQVLKSLDELIDHHK